MRKLKDIHAAIVKDNKTMKGDFAKAFKTTDRFAKKMQKRIAKINFERIEKMRKVWVK